MQTMNRHVFLAACERVLQGFNPYSTNVRADHCRLCFDLADLCTLIALASSDPGKGGGEGRGIERLC